VNLRRKLPRASGRAKRDACIADSQLPNADFVCAQVRAYFARRSRILELDKIGNRHSTIGNVFLDPLLGRSYSHLASSGRPPELGREVLNEKAFFDFRDCPYLVVLPILSERSDTFV
jgi:hypothetical protein